MEDGEEAIVIKKEANIVATTIATTATPTAAPAPQNLASTPVAKEEKTTTTVSKGTPITSPMVGAFYAAPAPGAKPFVKVGDTVSTGQVVCIVEAMKLMNEIESEVSGKIVEICVEDGQSVEYGQVLMYVE